MIPPIIYSIDTDTLFYRLQIFPISVGFATAAGRGQHHQADGPQRLVRPRPQSFSQNALSVSCHPEQAKYDGRCLDFYFILIRN